MRQGGWRRGCFLGWSDGTGSCRCGALGRWRGDLRTERRNLPAGAGGSLHCVAEALGCSDRRKGSLLLSKVVVHKILVLASGRIECSIETWLTRDFHGLLCLLLDAVHATLRGTWRGRVLLELVKVQSLRLELCLKGRESSDLGKLLLEFTLTLS